MPFRIINTLTSSIYFPLFFYSTQSLMHEPLGRTLGRGRQIDSAHSNKGPVGFRPFFVCGVAASVQDRLCGPWPLIHHNIIGMVTRQNIRKSFTPKIAPINMFPTVLIWLIACHCLLCNFWFCTHWGVHTLRNMIIYGQPFLC